MSTYATTQTITTVSDLRQVAEGEAVAGPESVQALPGSIALGEGSSLTMTGADQETVSGLLSNLDSTMSGLLGLNSQMQQGIFEMAPAIAAETASAQQGMFTSQLSDVESQIGSQTAESSKLIIAAVAAIALLFLLKRK